MREKDDENKHFTVFQIRLKSRNESNKMNQMKLLGLVCTYDTDMFDSWLKREGDFSTEILCDGWMIIKSGKSLRLVPMIQARDSCRDIILQMQIFQYQFYSSLT